MAVRAGSAGGHGRQLVQPAGLKDWSTAADIPLVCDECGQDRLRQVEAELARKVEELARRSGELEQLAHAASHDLQEPLRMVVAYTQLLAERYRGKLDESADKFIEYASEGAMRMQAMIQDLLIFSRAGRPGVVCESVDCNAVIDEVVRSLSGVILESGAVVTYGELPVIWANRAQITQVFQNLVGNALKFRRQTPPEITVTAEQSGGNWEFSVKDNGIGIAPEHFENIFVVFQRLHSRTEYPGNGIGLAISRKITEGYGGRLWVESESGEGSTFKFTAPLAVPETQITSNTKAKGTGA